MRLLRGRVGAAVLCWLLAATLLTGVALVASRAPRDLPGAPALGGASFVVALALLALQAAVLARAAREWPATALVTVSVAAPLGALVGMGPAVGSTTVVVLVATFVAVSRRRTTPRGTWSAAGLAALLVATGDLVAQVGAGEPYASAVAAALVQGLGTVGLPALVALVVTSRREARSATLERTRAVEGEQVALVEAAVSRERTAMARELHDIAAHHLSGIAVMSAAIGRQIDTDPEGAKRAVAQVREQSRAMLDDMRGLVGLLRPTGADGGASERGVVREESLAGIASLAASALERGEQVRYDVTPPSGEDPRARIGPLAQLSAYRTVQEALTNAARHAPGRPCRVALDASRPDLVTVTVTNDLDPDAGAAPAPRSGGGFGLVGMRERAELTHARLSCGPVGNSWVVAVEIPVRDAARLTSEEAP